MKNKLTKIWDNFIYYQAYKTLRRMTTSNPALSYLFELHLREWNIESSISDNLKYATEEFHKAFPKK